MGSKFLNPVNAIDPGAIASLFGNRNSGFLARMSSYDPLVSSSAGKYLAPAEHDAGQAYTASHLRNTGDAQGKPLAGVAPTLGDALNSYQQPAAAPPPVRPGVPFQPVAPQPKVGMLTPQQQLYGSTGYG